MNYQVDVSQLVDEKEWDETLLKNQASTTYQTTDWPKVYFDSFNSQPYFITIKDSKGTITAQN